MIPPPHDIGADMTNKIHQDKPPRSPLSFKIRPAESSFTDGLERFSGVLWMAVIPSVFGAILFVGLIAAILWVRDSGAPVSLSSNAAEIEKQSALPLNDLTSAAARAAPTLIASQSPNAQAPARGTATKTSPARKGAPSATKPPSPTSVRAPTRTPASPGRPQGPAAAATRIPTRTPTAAPTRRPPTAYPPGGAPPPPGTCVLGCD